MTTVEPPVKTSSWKSTLRIWLDPRVLARKIIMLEDSPRSIALGTAIGVFIAFTPTVGFQMALVLIVAAICRPLFRFNQIAGLIAVYISNPITTVPIYWFCYKLGTVFVEGSLTQDAFADLMTYEGFAEWCQTLGAIVWQMGWPLILGSTIVATICGIISYPITFYSVRGYQRAAKRIAEAKRKKADANKPAEVSEHQEVEIVKTESQSTNV